MRVTHFPSSHPERGVGWREGRAGTGVQERELKLAVAVCWLRCGQEKLQRKKLTHDKHDEQQTTNNNGNRSEKAEGGRGKRGGGGCRVQTKTS